MINITGLTTHQVALLDHMWSLQDIEDYEEWKNNLTESTMNTVDTLEQLVYWAQLDDITDVSKAVAYLNGIRLFGARTL